MRDFVFSLAKCVYELCFLLRPPVSNDSHIFIYHLVHSLIRSFALASLLRRLNLWRLTWHRKNPSFSNTINSASSHQANGSEFHVISISGVWLFLLLLAIFDECVTSERWLKYMPIYIRIGRAQLNDVDANRMKKEKRINNSNWKWDETKNELYRFVMELVKNHISAGYLLLVRLSHA